MLAQPQMLTTQEQKVLEVLKEGLSNQSIGLRLGITEKTVKYHLTAVYRKLGVTGDRELLAKIATGALLEQLAN